METSPRGGVNLDEVRTAIIKPSSVRLGTVPDIRALERCTARSRSSTRMISAHHRESTASRELITRTIHAPPADRAPAAGEGASRIVKPAARPSWPQWMLYHPQSRTNACHALRMDIIRDLQALRLQFFAGDSLRPGCQGTMLLMPPSLRELEKTSASSTRPRLGGTTPGDGGRSGHGAMDQIEFNVQKRDGRSLQRSPSMCLASAGHRHRPGYGPHHQRHRREPLGGLARTAMLLLRDPKNTLGLPNAEDGARA